MRWLSRSGALPAAARARIKGLLAPEEEVLRWAALTADGILAVTRLALHAAADGEMHRWGWAELAKVSLQTKSLTVVPTVQVQRWPDGTHVVRDAPGTDFVLVRPDRLTDQVHARVRRSVAASAYVDTPAAAGWAALRRVPGEDGLRRQVRLDDGSDPEAADFAVAVNAVFLELTAEAAASDPLRRRRPTTRPRM